MLEIFRDVELTDEQRQEVKAAADALHAVCEKYDVPMSCVVTLTQSVDLTDGLHYESLRVGTNVKANPVTLTTAAVIQGDQKAALAAVIQFMDATE
ncbi:hypothetical protein [Escherichia coli]|uniref:hypothetical protein n=1 Tax=Escherichia coli TaxID=562 RepID=UPI001C406DA4|nr:hypothetical protein [Escherichia coli]